MKLLIAGKWFVLKHSLYVDSIYVENWNVELGKHTTTKIEIYLIVVEWDDSGG